jgi:hypothetical protein
VKRPVLIAVVAFLLLLSEGVILYATRAESAPAPISAGLILKPISAGLILSSASASILRLQELAFYYRQDEAVRFLSMKNLREHELEHILPASELPELARKAYKASTVETQLISWRKHGGPAPHCFSAKIHLYNQSNQALVETPLKVVVRVKMGVLKVDPVLHLTDYDNLNRTAQWMTIRKSTVIMAALAPGMDKQLDVLDFELLPFLAAHPGYWPTEMEVSVKVLDLPLSKQTLTLLPDHFVPLTGQM